MQQLVDNPEPAAVVGVSLSGLWALVTHTVFLSTGFPAFIGATLHAVQKYKKTKLTVSDFLIAYATAGAVGFWGGPWLAELMPATEKALPIIAFASAYFGTEILGAVRPAIEAAIKKKIGG